MCRERLQRISRQTRKRESDVRKHRTYCTTEERFRFRLKKVSYIYFLIRLCASDSWLRLKRPSSSSRFVLLALYRITFLASSASCWDRQGCKVVRFALPFLIRRSKSFCSFVRTLPCPAFVPSFLCLEGTNF